MGKPNVRHQWADIQPHYQNLVWLFPPTLKGSQSTSWNTHLFADGIEHPCSERNSERNTFSQMGPVPGSGSGLCWCHPIDFKTNTEQIISDQARKLRSTRGATCSLSHFEGNHQLRSWTQHIVSSRVTNNLLWDSLLLREVLRGSGVLQRLQSLNSWIHN